MLEDKRWNGFLKTLNNWKGYILKFVESRISNDVTEGLNNLIRYVKRISFAIPNFDHMRIRVLSKGTLKNIITRIIRGSEEEIMKIIKKSGRSQTVNTSFVESRNDKYRKDNTRLNRKTMCHSKKIENYDAQANILTVAFNYCRQNEALKELLNPNVGLFEAKYLRRSPAMADSSSHFGFSLLLNTLSG